MTLDVSDCEFGCGKRATGVREYKWERQAKWLGACDECDANARTRLALAERRFSMVSPLDTDASPAVSSNPTPRVRPGTGPGGGLNFGRPRGSF